MTAEMLVEKEMRRRGKIKAALLERFANGETIGRPRKVSKSQVLKLRSEGHTLRQTAEILGVSKTTVCKAQR